MEALTQQRDSVRRDGALWLIAALVCFLPALLEAGSFLSFRRSVLEHLPVSTWSFITGSTLTTFIVVTAHFLPLVIVERWLSSRSPRLSLWFWPLVAGALVFVMQDSALRGEGARSSSHYRIVAPVFAIVAPLATSGVVFLLAHGRRLSLGLRRVLLVVILAQGWAFNLLLLTRYQQFHAYLIAFNVVLTYLFLRTFSFRIGRGGRHLTWSVLAFPLVLLPTLSDGERTARAMLRYSHFASSALQYLPLARPWAPPALAAVQPKQRVPEGAARLFESRLAPKEPRSTALGKNVLFIVLESTRWDDWADERVTPSFHRWRRHGVYFPRAIAAFPATPFGYGALFTGQPASVLVHTPEWARNLPFSKLVSRFDHLLLTQSEEFPSHVAVSEYFVPPGNRINAHRDAAEALAYLRQGIARASDSESFFAWAHLYEPHHPWVLQPEHVVSGASQPPTVHDAYRSELHYVDEHLGKFMDWFYGHGAAKDTLVVVIADHGEGMGELVEGRPLIAHNAHTHSAVAWIPAYLSGPGLPRDFVANEHQVTQLDVMPTVFDFLSVSDTRQTMQGRSIYDLLAAPPNGAVRSIATEVFGHSNQLFFSRLVSVRDAPSNSLPADAYPDVLNNDFQPKVALQRGLWKLHHDLVLDRFRLYDLATDPTEQTDLAKQNPEKLNEMRQALGEWRLQQAWVIQRMEAAERNERRP